MVFCSKLVWPGHPRGPAPSKIFLKNCPDKSSEQSELPGSPFATLWADPCPI
jgi:hypothetical protein